MEFVVEDFQLIIMNTSVCNTLKRALLIWFSVYIFGNQVGYMSAVGTIMVILGVLFYIHSKHIDKNIKEMVTRKV